MAYRTLALPRSKATVFHEIISYAVWLYYRFSLSLHDVEELLAYRGIEASYETVQNWEGKFGSLYADVIRRDRPKAGNKWHHDEVDEGDLKPERAFLWEKLYGGDPRIQEVKIDYNNRFSDRV